MVSFTVFVMYNHPHPPSKLIVFWSFFFLLPSNFHFYLLLPLRGDGFSMLAEEAEYMNLDGPMLRIGWRGAEDGLEWWWWLWIWIIRHRQIPSNPPTPAEATGLGFVCFVVINPCVLSASRVDFGLFFPLNFPITPPPLPRLSNIHDDGWR